MAETVTGFPSEVEEWDTRQLEQLLGWRVDQLVHAGFDIKTAVVLANRKDIDLHEACDLATTAGAARAAAILL